MWKESVWKLSVWDVQEFSQDAKICRKEGVDKVDVDYLLGPIFVHQVSEVVNRIPL